MEICFVTPRFPYPATRGDQVRTYHQIRSLSNRHAITLIAGCEEPVADSAHAEMARWCERIETVPVGGWRSYARLALRGAGTKLPLQVLFYDCPALAGKVRETLGSRTFDVVHASLIRMAPYVWDVKPPVVVDLTDTLSRSLASRRGLSQPLRAVYELERRRIERYEREVCARFPRLVVSAEADRAALGFPNVEVVRNAVDTQRFPFTLDGREDELVMMTGNLGYQPNVDAAVWFTQEVWPLIRAEAPAARLRFVGSRPAPAVRRLERVAGVEVLGPVSRMQDQLRRATVAICPMRCGSGIQNKLLEAMASGAPVVSTPQGNEGVAAAADRELLIAEQPGAFADAVLRLLRNPALRAGLAQTAHELIEREFDWDHHAHRFEAVYAAAMA